MRKTRVAILVVAIAFVVLGIRVAVIMRQPPSIAVANVRYLRTNDVFRGDCLKVSFTFKNSGPSTFFYNPEDEEIYRVETTKGWETNDWRFTSSSSASRVVGSGEEVNSALKLPIDARRWQVGYYVHTLTPRDAVARLLPRKIQSRFFPSLFGLEGEEPRKVWGPVFEIDNPVKAQTNTQNSIPGKS
jgi:hypothetical protein